MKRKYLFLTPSGKTHEVDDDRKWVSRHAQVFADRTGEKVETFLCRQICVVKYPTVRIPKDASGKEKVRLKKIGRL